MTPRVYFAKYGDIFGCRSWGWGEGRACYWHLVIETRDAAKYSRMHGQAPTKE